MGSLKMIGGRRRRTLLVMLAAMIMAGGVLPGAASPSERHSTVVYVLARSGSMGAPAGACGSRLACVKAAVTAVNAQLVGRSTVAWTGLAVSNPSASARDVDFGATGAQLLVMPQRDGNGNGSADIADAVNRVSLGGSTCYACGLEAAHTIVAESTAPSTQNIVVFLADRPSLVGPAVSTLAGAFGPDTVIRAIALGPRATCGEERIKVGRAGRTEVWIGSLAPVAALTPGGSCVHTNDFEGLAAVIEAAIG